MVEMLGSLKLDGVVVLATLLTLIAMICFWIAVRSSRTSPFSIKRTDVSLSGGSRTEISKPLAFAIGTILCLALAAGLIAYRSTDIQVGVSKRTVNGQK
jgi:ABC-type Fe3+ transport system permease subunit